MSEPEYVSEIDLARCIELPGSEWRACVAIGPDGAESLWLVSPTPTTSPDAPATAAPPTTKTRHTVNERTRRERRTATPRL